MNDEKYLLDWYSNHIWSRPKPSKVCDGVGSFAIRDIPKGTSIYDLADKTVSAWISWSKVSTLPIGVVGCIYDTQPQMGTITNSTVNYTSDGTGTLPYDHGGTGSSTAPANQILIGRATAWELSGAATGAIIIPLGDDSQRPVGVEGMLRLNNQGATRYLEYYDGSNWIQITP